MLDNIRNNGIICKPLRNYKKTRFFRTNKNSENGRASKKMAKNLKLRI